MLNLLNLKLWRHVIYIIIICTEYLLVTPISFRVKLMDVSGEPHHYTSGYPLRYYIYVSQHVQDTAQLQEKAVNETLAAPKQKKNNGNPMISVLAQGDSVVRDASVKTVENDDSTQTLQLMLHKDSKDINYILDNLY